MLRNGLELARTATLVLAPHGGQRRARENARRAVHAQSALATSRADAALAIERAAHPAGLVHADR